MGLKKWISGGGYHRIDGPAVEWADGTKEWWVNGKLHRLDGPAVEDSNGSNSWYENDGRKIWWIDGKVYTKWEAVYIIITQYKPTAKDILKLMSYIRC